MARPEDLPEWATGADAEIVAPPSEVISRGWTAIKVPFQWLNHWFHNVFKWLEWLDAREQQITSDVATVAGSVETHNHNGILSARLPLSSISDITSGVFLLNFAEFDAGDEPVIVSWIKIRNMISATIARDTIILNFPMLVKLGGATDLFISSTGTDNPSIPEGLRPTASASNIYSVHVVNGLTLCPGAVVITSGGVVSFSRLSVGSSHVEYDSTFTPSTDKGWCAFTIMYNNDVDLS